MRRRRDAPVLPDVFRGRDAVDEGVLTPSQLRSSGLVRVLHGVYRPVGVADSHELRCRAAALVLPRTARFTGRSAAHLLGCSSSRAGDDIEVLLPEGVPCKTRPGVRIRRSRLPIDGGPTTADGLRLAPVHRIAFDLAARRPLPEAVGHLDAFVRSGALTAADFRDWCDTVRLNDVVAVRAAAALVDPRSESVPESRLRVVLHLAGIDLEPQHVVRNRGRAVARVDLADVERRVAVEYDGVWHVLKEQLDRDRRRLNALRALGWSVVHVTAEMMGTPDEVVHTVRRALQSAARRDLA